LLRLAQAARSQPETEADTQQLQALNELLKSVNDGVRSLHYVAEATKDLNDELKALSHHHAGYNVSLDTGAIGIEQFIEQLELGASTNGSRVMLGGDGRNNQILLALWKAKSVLEHDQNSEVVIYCVEEPEAHLHPHQQRKLASYLISALPGQTIVTSHSPQIAASYRPNSIVRLLRDNGASRAASQGCSACIDNAWTGLGYRISILPAEAFFASAVMLVEGPSEMLFYAHWHFYAKSTSAGVPINFRFNVDARTSILATRFYTLWAKSGRYYHGSLHSKSGISIYLRKSGSKFADLATGNATLDLLRGGTYDSHVEKLLDGVVIPSLVSYEKV